MATEIPNTLEFHYLDLTVSVTERKHTLFTQMAYLALPSSSSPFSYLSILVHVLTLRHVIPSSPFSITDQSGKKDEENLVKALQKVDFIMQIW